VADLLTAMGVKYQIDIASGRGFEYYTGMIFQMFKGEIKLGGGGRYDALIPLMGGKNTPASGFALQMNTLMNAIEMPVPAGPEVNKILLIINASQPDLVKSAYNTAGSLRKAGFIVSIHVDTEDKADFKWVIEISAAAPEFTVINQENKRKVFAQTIVEVLKLLGENSGS